MQTLNLILTLLAVITGLWFLWDKELLPFQKKRLTTPSAKEVLATVLASDPVADWIKTQTSAKQTVSYRHNPALRFEMSHGDDGIQCRNFREPWANGHPDSDAVGYWCDLYFGPTLIKRFILVGVDGVRALVPPPVKADGMPGGHAVQPLAYQVARIHDTTCTLDEYMRRSHLKVATAAATKLR